MTDNPDPSSSPTLNQDLKPPLEEKSEAQRRQQRLETYRKYHQKLKEDPVRYAEYLAKHNARRSSKKQSKSTDKDTKQDLKPPRKELSEKRLLQRRSAGIQYYKKIREDPVRWAEYLAKSNARRTQRNRNRTEMLRMHDNQNPSSSPPTNQDLIPSIKEESERRLLQQRLAQKRYYKKIREDPVQRPEYMAKLSAQRRARLEKEAAQKKILDPEKNEEVKARKTIATLNRRSKLSEEDIARKKQNKYFCYLATKGRMTEEEKEEHKRVSRMYGRTWRENLSGEKYRRHLDNIMKWQKKNYLKIKAENPEKYKEWLEKAKENQKRIKENWTEEDRKKIRIRYRVSQRKAKLKKQAAVEGWSEETLNRKLWEMEDGLWKEGGYTEGKPPPKERQKSGGRPKVYKNEEILPRDSFICLKCIPVWTPDENRWKPVGYMTKFQLLRHVKLRHKDSFWACSYCDILKYSKFSLDIHLKVCKKAKDSNKLHRS